jgi:hypothetical protein
MTRYIRRFSRIGHSLGPSEERGFEMWVGYDIEGDVACDDFISVDGWSDEQLAAYGVAAFKPVTAEELKRWMSSEARPPRSPKK